MPGAPYLFPASQACRWEDTSGLKGDWQVGVACIEKGRGPYARKP